MLVVIAAGVFLGLSLDKYFSFSIKIFTAVFSLIFIIISIYHVINQVKKNE
tara:strand:+ start:491 stop:643 length:153 start_codon:yes stop_codon:yes gene_type:complete